ncbi:ectoine/hydroxyectoine ABC transporter permease subunit EhuD [Ornithinimicrobium sediminis]|uniref:ectoine/hydroxyectoine ABC transporter permease subunit EhuD n=1 Tax=Ornithinimicrobium sediminis TaxID=2904603 RepID=UPI001E59864D|nr:ectoine/hydroxyectoine ABC transporter permease subunit EhuD [Ornithinimicrobium sediminis]
MSFDWEFALQILPDLLEAFVRITLLVTVVGSLTAAVLGLVWAIGLRSLPAWVGRPLSFVLDFIRMTPLPIQLLFVYYTFNNLSALSVGIIVIGVHYSTYMAESYRAGIESIRKGQWEAATALSLPPHRTWRAVILPQALRATLPSLGNWAIAMFKDTPFLIVIAVPELVTEAKEIGGRTFSYVEPFTLAGLIFLVASYPTAVLMRKLENRLAY